MRQSHILLINSTAAFLRSIFSIGISVVVSRLLITRLGVYDFGILMAIGATGASFALISNAFSASALRHLAHDIGRNDIPALKQHYSAVMLIYSLLALLVLIIGFRTGPSILRGINVSPEDLPMTSVAFTFVVVRVATLIFKTPCHAALLAKQLNWVTALFQTAFRLVDLLAVITIAYTSESKLIVYTCVCAIGTLFFVLVQFLVQFLAVPQCRFSIRYVNLHGIRHVTSYALWKLFPNIVTTLRDQGLVMFVFSVYGNALSAAAGVAQRVHGVVSLFASNISSVIEPAITQADGRQDEKRFHEFSAVSSKFAMLSVIIVSIPIIIDPDPLLKAWLITPPAHSATFITILLLARIATVSSWGHNLAMQARGKIAGIGLIQSLPFLPAFMFVILFCHKGNAPIYLPHAIMAATQSFIAIFLIPLFASSRCNFSMHRWFQEVLYPLGRAIIVPLIACIFVKYAMPPVFLRVVAVSITWIMLLFPFCWFFALSDHERTIFSNLLHLLLRKVIPSR